MVSAESKNLEKKKKLKQNQVIPVFLSLLLVFSFIKALMDTLIQNLSFMQISNHSHKSHIQQAVSHNFS